MLDDCIVYRFGPDDFMVVVNAACAAGDFATLRARLPEGVRMAYDGLVVDVEGE